MKKKFISSITFLTLLSLFTLTHQKKNKKKEKSGYKTKYIVELISPGAKTQNYADLVGKIVNQFGPDELTPNGERQQYTLGQQIREEYSDLFKGEAEPKDFRVFSPQSPASQSSARAHIFGLFPRFKHNKINVVVNETRYPPWDQIKDNFELSSTALPFGYKPISLIIDSEDYDTRFFPSLYKACPNAGRQETDESGDYMIILESAIKDYADKLMKQGFTPQKYFDKNVWIPERLSLVFDSLHSQYFYDNKMVATLKPEDFKSLQIISGMYKIAKHFPNKVNLKVYTHSISQILIEEFTLGTKKGRKFTLFSGLEKTMLAFITALNLTSFDCLKDRFVNNYDSEKCVNPPQFSSSLVFALVQNEKGEDFVNIRYNGKTVEFCDDRKNSEYCPFEIFANKTQNVMMLESLSAFCGEDEMVTPDTAELKSLKGYLNLAKYSLMAACLSMLVLIILSAFCFGEANFLSKRDNPLDPEGKFSDNEGKKSKEDKEKEKYDARLKSHPTEPAELEPQPLEGGINFDASKEEEEEDPSFRFDHDEIKKERERKEVKGPVDVTETDRKGINESQNMRENPDDDGDDVSYVGNRVKGKDPI